MVILRAIIMQNAVTSGYGVLTADTIVTLNVVACTTVAEIRAIRC